MHAQRENECGFTALALVMVLVPLLFLVGSYLHTMTGRNQRLLLEEREEQAMLTAESGIDFALHEARRGVLVAGPGRRYDFAGTLPSGSRYEVAAVYLKGDSLDNDGDGVTDEADEDVFRVTSTGFNGTSKRRVAAYLGFTTYLPVLASATTITNPGGTIDIGGSGRVIGLNHSLAGALTGTGDGFGIAIVPPGTVVYLTSQVTGGETTRVTGTGGTPSLGSGAAVDVQEIVDFARNGAGVVLTNANLSSGTIGSAAAPVIAYREGNLRIQGNTTGYGLLVINGSADIRGTFSWYGVVVCTGTFDCGSGTAQVYGATLLGPSSPTLRLRGTIDLRYSSAGVTMASNLTGRYVAFNGWQEITTRD